MMRPSVQGVDPPVCCILDVTVTYARDSFVDSQAGPFVLSRGGGPRYPGTRLTGARRLHPPRPPSVPPWDLEVVLKALSHPSFEPLTSVDLKELSIKIALCLPSLRLSV